MLQIAIPLAKRRPILPNSTLFSEVKSTYDYVMVEVWITRSGGPEVFFARDTANPVPRRGQVCVAVTHAGVNFADILARRGQYPEAPQPPFIVGYEICGRINSVGLDVPSTWLGKRVLAVTFFGGYASHVCVPLSHVFELPDSLGDAEACCLPVNYGTALGMLEASGRLAAGDTVLVHSAGGGVGLALIDLCRQRQIRVIGLAAAWKHDRLLQRGVFAAVDPNQSDLNDEIKRLTAGTGVKAIFNSSGGTTWMSDAALLEPFGQLILFGNSSVGAAAHPQFSPLMLMQKNFSVLGFNLATIWKDHFSRFPLWIRQLTNAVVEKQISPHIDSVFPLRKAHEAHAHIEGRRNFGKVLLQS